MSHVGRSTKRKKKGNFAFFNLWLVVRVFFKCETGTNPGPSSSVRHSQPCDATEQSRVSRWKKMMCASLT